MLAKRLIPCLDVKDGRVVKGIHFLNLQDAGDPVEVAGQYSEQGADEICFLDINASHENRKTILDVVERTASRCFCPLTVGGGVRALQDVRDLLLAGADKVSINSAAVKTPHLIEEASASFGAQCIVLAIDAKRVDLLKKRDAQEMDSDEGQPALCRALDMKVHEALAWMHGMNRLIGGITRYRDEPGTRWNVYIHGGRIDTGLNVLHWARLGVKLGAGEILITSMDADGTQRGYDIALTRAMAEAVGVPVIASGGAGNLEHLAQAFLEGKADAALAASIFHYQKHSIREAKQYLKERGITIRECP